MIHDRAQKKKALQYLANKQWYPQLEVELLPYIDTSKFNKPITDIDVLAFIPDEFEGYKKLIIDCKTKKNESPIARTLWLRGLMQHVNASRAICILKRDSIPNDHRLFASNCGILLLTETDFDTYIEVTNNAPTTPIGNIGDINIWDKYYSISSQYPKLQSAIDFSRKRYWMSESDSHACRRTITQLVRIMPELNPDKPEHIAISLDLVSLFMHALTGIVSDVFAGYLHPANRSDLSNALLYLLYGGRERYKVKNYLNRLIKPSNQQSVDADDLLLPEWDRFLQLFRTCLDSPTEVAYSSFLVREFGWTILKENNLDIISSGECLQSFANAHLQAAKLSLLGAEYLFKAAKLPPEFAEYTSAIFLSIQNPPESTHL